MKIKFSFLLLFFMYSRLFAIPTPLDEMRTLYKQAASSEDACSKLIKFCDEQKSVTNPTALGYKGCATMMMAKYFINPYSKWSAFSSGKEMLEQAINTYPTNVELRFLRFTIQKNVPAFLGYNNNITSDKIFLLNEIKRLKDLQLKNTIVEFMAQSN